jgi:hypothetical protein
MISTNDFTILSITTIDMMCVLPVVSRHLPAQQGTQTLLFGRSELAKG